MKDNLLKFVLFFLCFFSLAAECRMPVVDGGSLSVRGNEYYWDAYELPLLVHIDSSLPRETKNVLRRAAQTWEDKVGFDLFEISETSQFSMEILGFPVRRTIGVTRSQLGKQVGTDAEINGLAEITLYQRTQGGDEGRILGCNMWIDTDLISGKIFKTTVHEFGHCLTLAHDDDTSSIMFYSSGADPDSYIKQNDILRIRFRVFR